MEKNGFCVNASGKNRSLASLNEDFCHEVLTKKQLFQFNKFNLNNFLNYCEKPNIQLPNP